MPIARSNEANSLAWRFTKTGCFTVTSGYKDALSLDDSPTDGSEDRKLWDLVWKLQVIPKIKFFIWKVLHNILSTSLNLTYRFVDVVPLCKHCEIDIESAEHALRDCT
ncbi:hypothetical protein ACS0TY_005683 [Phlomoides rotata]